MEVFLLLLVIDVGNTNVVLGVYSGEELIAQWRLTSQKRTVDEVGFTLLGLLNASSIKKEDLAGGVYASVVPSLDETFIRAVEEYLGVSCLKISADLDLGVRVKTKHPHETGADRLLNAVSAKEKYGTPVIVVDLGTAITLDVVSAEGDYLGGAIAPGMEIGMELLFSKAAKLPQIALVAPEKYIGPSTTEAIQSGIVYGFVGMVDTLARGIFRELGTQCRVVATGGHAGILAAHSEIVTDVDQSLTLEGMRIVYERSRRA